MTIRGPRPRLSVRLPVGVAAGVVAAVVGLGLVHGGGPSYGDAVRAQRRAVTRAPATPPRVPGGGEVLLCARGATTFASAAATAAGAALRRSDGVVDPVVLAAASSAAIEAGRWAETAAGGPALPRRVGTAGGVTVAPPEARCDGAPAFAQARVSTRPALPATPPPPVKAPAASPPAKRPAAKPRPATPQPQPATTKPQPASTRRP